jgi:hypothetical protein
MHYILSEIGKIGERFLQQMAGSVNIMAEPVNIIRTFVFSQIRIYA